jgi:ATP-dependent helicase/nuclease subunit B
VNPATLQFDRIAQRILAAHPAPDLRGITVLLPNMHAAQPLAQALVRHAKVPALLLPQMITLDAWAQGVPLAASVTPESQRSAMLYQQLRERRWFDNADLWGMTQELLKLFDQLTLSLHALPEDEAAFTAAVERAYQARQNEALQLEARLVFELWHAMQQGAELDAARAWQQRLARLAQSADRPLYVLRASEWDAVEQRFLEEYEQHAVVKVFDLREMGPLAYASSGTPSNPNPLQLPLVRGRAEPTPPLTRGGREGLGERVKFFPATSLEQEARAAAMQVRLWLNEGKRDIAIVAQDRVAARRLRALLERAEVLVADETGWTFATLSVSTVLDRWLGAVQSDFYHHDLLDLLKSPFIFADLAAGERKNIVYQLEQTLRKHGVVSGLEAFIALAGHDASLHAPLARLRQAAAVLGQDKRRTLVEWLVALRESLALLGIDLGLQRDEAGQQLLRACDEWQRELAQDTGRYRFSEWRRWLMQQLDIKTFRDSSIESPVRFTHLAATRWRAFDAVLLLGCDADHLPSVADGGGFFNDAVRASFGLPTRSFHAVRQRDDLHGLLAMNDTVLVTWQKERNGEEGLLSPFLQLLRDDTGGGEAVELPALLAQEDARSVPLPQAVQPAPQVAAAIVPGQVSISAYNSLVACPYQFHARHILRLNELDEVQEAIEKRDYGERVHEVLQRFHDRYPLVSGQPQEVLTSALHEISAEVFADLLAQDFAARAWLARWHKSLPAYLEWQQENEAQGWRYAGAEQKFGQALDGVQLTGRIDRLDVRGDEKRVLDYKTQSETLLRGKLKEPGEDVQLACYAHAVGAEEAAFVSIEDGKVKLVTPKEEMAQLAQLNAARLEQVMAEMRSGAGLPANGIDAACTHCEVRGVCRKGEWTA